MPYQSAGIGVNHMEACIFFLCLAAVFPVPWLFPYFVIVFAAPCKVSHCSETTVPLQ